MLRPIGKFVFTIESPSRYYVFLGANKYSMSSTPFIGLNRHYQPILFGCALLQDESKSSFT